MKKVKIAALALVASALLLGFTTAPVEAQGIWDACNGSASKVCADADGTQATTIVKRLINVFLFIIGILSVIMIIHSGFKYTTSRGDAEGVKSAKNTLMYAVTGLIVAMMAYAIVKFVVGAFATTEETQPSDTSTPVQSGQPVRSGEDR